MNKSGPVNDEPKDVVSFKILLNKTALSGDYSINSIDVTKIYNKIASAKIVIADGDPSRQDFEISSNEDLLIPGKDIEIQLGYHAQTVCVFKGVITSHSIRADKNKHSALTIEARDKAVILSFGRRNHCFIDKSDADMMQSIAGDAAIDADISSTSVHHKEMVQYNASDWDFIVSRAEMNGMLVLTDDNKLTVKKPDTASKPFKEITFGSDIIEFNSSIDVRSQLKEVKSYSWNYKDQKIEESPDASVSYNETGNLKADDLASAMGIKEYQLIHSGSLSDDEMSTWGNAQLLKSRMAKTCGKIKIRGLAEIKPGHVIKLIGFSKRFNGNVLVTGVRHNYDESIWETEILFGLSENWFYQRDDIIDKPASGMIPGVNGLQIGIVMQLENDPDKEDRIKIKLPLVDSHDGIWARVASFDAGNERGSFFRPELQDEVVVGFLNDDPRHAIVLGMLNSSAKPSPFQSKDTNHEKGWITRSKMKVVFNDEKKTLNIETPAGKKIIINDDDDSIILSDQNRNKISMTPDGVIIESGKDVSISASSGNVNIKGLQIELKADTKFTAQANASAELTSSGQTVVKGSIVNIN